MHPMQRRVRVYTASKIRHKPRWQTRAQLTSQIEFCARWIWAPDTPDLSDVSFWDRGSRTRLWTQNIQDVQYSDCVVGYMETRDDLHGTLVEIGVALGLGKPVHLVGAFDNHHSWQWHPLCFRHESLDEAFHYIQGESS